MVNVREVRGLRNKLKKSGLAPLFFCFAVD
jgi:hypothetical protein